VSLPPGSGHLFRNLVLFARLLRRLGVDVGPVQLGSLVEATQAIDLRSRLEFRDAAEVVLVRHREQLGIFRRAFDLFWQARDPRQLAELDLGLLVQRTRESRRPTPFEVPTGEDQGAGEVGDDDPVPREVRTWSDADALRRKDFAELDAGELDQVRALLATLRWRPEPRRTRRRVASRKGPFLDPRSSLRRSLTKGGEILDLSWRRRKLKPRPLVVLCDISGSMEPYSRVLLQFLYVVTRGMGSVEAFVFGTRLTRITHQLRERDVDAALEAVHHEVVDFGGGTRIGEALSTFNVEWGRRVLGRGATVLLISDGWDRGDPAVLGREMDRLRRSCHRLIWLNPLLGSPRYEPLTRGIRAALPHIDDFLPVHNLESLEQLGRHLERLARRQTGVRRIA